MSPHTSIVMTTRDRRDRVLDTLPRLLALPDVAEIIVIDDASRDDTAAAVRQAHPEVTVLSLDESRGSAARTLGVEHAATPYVAFADDDSWWDAGSFARAAAVFAACPAVGLIAARILVGPDDREDPVNEAMATSPLDHPDLPGPEVLGFVACGAIVRRDAYLAVGGFHPRMHIGGEEELLALDLRRHGWHSVYVADVVARHHPEAGERPGRRRRLARNALWTAWLRRRPAGALRVTAKTVRQAVGDRATAAGVLEAARGLPWVLRQRTSLPVDLERSRTLLERA